MSKDHIPPPYTRGDIPRTKLLSLGDIPEMIAARRVFKSSQFHSEQLELNGNRPAYIVWLGGLTAVLAYVDDEWFAASDLKLRPKPTRQTWSEILTMLQPTMVKQRYMATVIMYGKTEVVKRMMGIERPRPAANKG